LAQNSVAVYKKNCLEVMWKDVNKVALEIEPEITAKVVLPKPSVNLIKYKEKEFKLVNIHFHSRSEHLFNGKSGSMEVHLLHQVINL
jgi:carbonic anhydrase